MSLTTTDIDVYEYCRPGLGCSGIRYLGGEDSNMLSSRH